MHAEFRISVIGDHILVVYEDGEEKTGYLVGDMSTLRRLVNSYLKREEDRERIMKSALAYGIPELSTKKAVIFSKASLEIWEVLIERANKALQIQDPLPSIPSGEVCIALGDSIGCLVFGFCDPNGNHRILILESLAGFRVAMQKELAWLEGHEREFYVAISEQAFKPINGSTDPEYTAIEGKFCEYLNTGSAWLDNFETLAVEFEGENKIGDYFNLPITPEG